ncbi:PCDAD protein, partial [Erpornis zantholeuca]|nr:PCDAD protein [Erpornis zantholeuca]
PGSRFPLEGASDADIGANAQLSYTLSPSEHFSLDLQKSHGRNTVPDLVLTKSLDRETIAVHRLVLTATDGGRPSLTGTMELVITVLDANDNPPQFNQSLYKVQLPESAAVGTLVARVNATDPDVGSNSEVTFTATSFNPPSGRDVISINPNTGEIHLIAALDFEEVNIFDFRIEARDGGTPPLSGHCRVELEVLDANDNAPEVWVTSLSVPVAEDALSENSPPGFRFPLEGASDADIGANAQLSYTLSPSDHFRIEEENSNSRSKSLFLVLTKSLDREMIPIHRLVLTASDGGRPSLTGTMELVISVVDANDNAPQFNQSVYNVHLPEDAIQGTLVARMNATDLDEGINRDVKY